MGYKACERAFKVICNLGDRLSIADFCVEKFVVAEIFVSDIGMGVVLFLGGVVGSLCNTIAGGGSLLTLPLLIWYGLPAPVANGTNRIFMLVQSGSGAASLSQGEGISWRETLVWSGVTLVFSLLGAWLATQISPLGMKNFMGVLMLVMFGWYILKVVRGGDSRDSGVVLFLRRPIVKALSFMCLGVYGGFIQAGMGAFVFLMFSSVCGMSAIRAMASKNFLIAFYTLPVLCLFLYYGQVEWIPGVILGSGGVLGAVIAGRLAGRISVKLVMGFVMLSMLISGVYLLIV